MSTVSELEQRLQRALGRIEAAIPMVPDSSVLEAKTAEVELLRQKLEEERQTNAELIERVKGLKERQETQVAELEDALHEARSAEVERSAVQVELKARVEELRDQIARLTDANRAMVGDPDLVNTAMIAELDAMRATRRADVIEVDEILARLQPPVNEESHA